MNVILFLTLYLKKPRIAGLFRERVKFIHGLWIYFILSFITTTISINHWRDVHMGPRRTADLIGAKLSFSYFSYQDVM
jgi:hypothetical protein